jgi:hypothetical protein
VLLLKVEILSQYRRLIAKKVKKSTNTHPMACLSLIGRSTCLKNPDSSTKETTQLM